MDLSKVGEKILSSVRTVRSLRFLPSSFDRPEKDAKVLPNIEYFLNSEADMILQILSTNSSMKEMKVPPRAAAAATVARALASLSTDQRCTLPTSSVEELEAEFYEEHFDPIKHLLEQTPDEDGELEYFEKKATIRLSQLDSISESLSRQVMEHHEKMVKGIHLVRELERDLKITTIICMVRITSVISAPRRVPDIESNRPSYAMNGHRHLTASMAELSRDLVVTSSSKRKQALLDILSFLTELGNALGMQKALERHVEGGDFCKAFQVLSEYLQLIDSLSDIYAVQEMSRTVEVWLAKTLQKLDSLLLQVCEEFKEKKYISLIDAYALIGDVSGLAEKIQSFFIQEVLTETHSLLKSAVLEGSHNLENSSRLTYSDLCLRIPESKFRICLIRTLTILFRLMSSFHAIMSFQTEDMELADRTLGTSNLKDDASPVIQEESQSTSELELSKNREANGLDASSTGRLQLSSDVCTNTISSTKASEIGGSPLTDAKDLETESSGQPKAASKSGCPWYDLRKEALTFVSQSLQRGRKNLWQLSASRVSLLLSSPAFCSTSIHQFLKNYDDLNVFISAGEAFCGAEASDIRSKLKAACESYFSSFHRQNIYALRMVLEKENWQELPSDAIQVVSFPGLIGDGAPFLASSDVMNTRPVNSRKLDNSSAPGTYGFSCWVKDGNPFSPKVSSPYRYYNASPFADISAGSGHMNVINFFESDIISLWNSEANSTSETRNAEDENEDLLADFIDEDSQRPSRISKKSSLQRTVSTIRKENEVTVQTGSSLCLLRFMDKYARLMQKLQIANVELFKGMREMFGVYYYFIYEIFGQQKAGTVAAGTANSLNYSIQTALNRINLECEQWIKPQLLQASSSLPTSMSSSHLEVTPTSPPLSFGLKERCVGVDTISCIARILHRSKSHLQSMLLQHNYAIVEDFFTDLIDSVPELINHIHKTTARLHLHIDEYVDRIASAKWELKELGMEHNGYVDLLLGEFKHYKARLVDSDIHLEAEESLLEYGVEIVAETMVEGLSRVKKCTDEGRALMSLDVQVLINGLKHFGPKDAKQKLHRVEAFVKAYYIPETEFVGWAHNHPEYTKSQMTGLINLVATMKGWKRKSRLEILEKIEQ